MQSENENQPEAQTWEDETADFYTPGEKPKPAAAEPERADDGKFKAKDDAAPAAAAAEPAKADAVDPDKEAADEIEGRKGDLPEWLQKRVGRVSKKEADLADREAKLAEREAKLAKPEPAKDDKQPDPLGFLPAHIDKAEFATATDFATEALPKDHGIFDPKLNISADVALAMTDIADGDKARMVEVADFVVKHPAIIDAINELPPRKRSAAFEKAFSEADAPKSKADTEKKPAGKKASDAPPPISRSKGNATINADDFISFSAQRDEEDRKAGYRV